LKGAHATVKYCGQTKYGSSGNRVGGFEGS